MLKNESELRRTVRVGVEIGKMVAANSAGWGGDREDGGGEQCGLGWR